MTDSAIIQVFASRLSRETNAILDSLERENSAAIRDPARRARYAQTRSFVRRVLSECLGCDPFQIAFGRTPSGKPFIVSEPRCAFSLSHSEDWIAVAVAPFEVGLDIEAHAPRVDPRALSARFFSPVDAALIERSGPAAKDEFLAQWVAKEAALKAVGTGIAGCLDKLRCDYAKGAVDAVSGPVGTFVIRPFLLEDGTPGAVAWSASIPAIPEIFWHGPVCENGSRSASPLHPDSGTKSGP